MLKKLCIIITIMCLLIVSGCGPKKITLEQLADEYIKNPDSIKINQEIQLTSKFILTNRGKSDQGDFSTTFCYVDEDKRRMACALVTYDNPKSRNNAEKYIIGKYPNPITVRGKLTKVNKEVNNGIDTYRFYILATSIDEKGNNNAITDCDFNYIMYSIKTVYNSYERAGINQNKRLRALVNTLESYSGKIVSVTGIVNFVENQTISIRIEEVGIPFLIDVPHFEDISSIKTGDKITIHGLALSPILRYLDNIPYINIIGNIVSITSNSNSQYSSNYPQHHFNASITGDDVILRSTPSTSGSILRTLSKGERVSAKSTGNTGDSNSAVLLVDLNSKVNGQTVKLKKGYGMYIVDDLGDKYRCNYYLDNVKRSAIVKKEWVQVAGKNDWVSVETNDGKSGFVYYKYVRYD